MSGEQLSLAQARRVAIAAQGLHRRRPDRRIDRRHLRRAIRDMGVIQIDSVNAVARSQRLVLFARLGAFPDDLIERGTQAGELFEYWVHEASFAPTADHHLYRWRMGQPPAWSGMARFAAERRQLIEDVARIVADTGPLVASDLQLRRGPKQQWWDWDDGKAALEVLFHSGRVSVARRRRDFARVYDLTERVLPAAVLNAPTPPEPDARKQLVLNAAEALGVATAADLADYHRQRASVVNPLIAELVEEARLLPVSVERWTEPAFVPPDVVVPRRVDAVALLSPFDPIVWFRPRAERLFDFTYRIEIYTPKHKRRFGYYVMPLLVGDTLCGRVDLRADRRAGLLNANAVWLEPDVSADPARRAQVEYKLRNELAAMAQWLHLDGVVHGGLGDLVW